MPNSFVEDQTSCKPLSEGEWKLWRDGEPFAQRFSATISDEGNTIAGRWEKAPDGGTWETDFDLTYRKAR
jgi:hypothetical protein